MTTDTSKYDVTVVQLAAKKACISVMTIKFNAKVVDTAENGTMVFGNDIDDTVILSSC